MAKNHYTYLVSKSWKYAEGYRLKMVFAYVCFILANVVMMSEPYVFGKLLNVLQLGGPNLLRDSILYLALFASLSLFFWIFHGTARVIERQISFHVVRHFTESIFETIASLPLKWHKSHHSGATINRVKKATNALKSFTDESYAYVETIVKFTISLVAIFIFMPTVGFLPLLLGAVIIFSIFKFDTFLGKTLDHINEREHVVTSTLFDYISNINTVITLRLEALAQKEVVRKIMLIFPFHRKNIRMNEVKWFTVSMGLAIMNFLILFFYIYQRISIGETILIGSLMTLYQYTGKFTSVFHNLAWQYEKLVVLHADISAMEGIFSAHDRLVRALPASIRLKNWHAIDIQHLHFKHQEERSHADEVHAGPPHVNHLDDISLELARGRRIAFVGESGSGKSTLLSLLRGLYDVDRVDLTVDGKTYNTLKVLSDFVTLIPQDPEIFENTIEYNITAGIHHTQKDLMEAIHLARFDRVIDRLPRGLATDIQEKGVNLSGGEKQRLAVARGLFASRMSSILLLDEPTSSMDPKNEIAIYKNIFKAYPDTCVISSIHRLNLLKMFDDIYVFSKGKIIQRGHFEDLLAQEGHFQEVWKSYLEHSQEKELAHAPD